MKIKLPLKNTKNIGENLKGKLRLNKLSKAIKDIMHFIQSKFKIYHKNIKAKNKKTIILSMLVIGALITSGVYIIKHHNKDSFQDAPMVVNIEKAKLDMINIKANFIGKIRTSESVTLTSEVVGKIVNMKKDGTFVKKGELILELDATEAEGKYMVALGKKNEEEMKLHMTEAMFKEGFKTENHVKEQKARYQTALGHLMEAQAYLNKHKIRAPFDGVIGLQNQSLGATINMHTKLVTVTNLNNLQVEFVISGSELRKLGGIEQIKAAEILFTLDGQLLPIYASFSAYETVVDAETNAISVRANLNLENQIASPGQLGNVTLNIGNKENVLTVPESAIESTHGGSYVYKVVNGTAIQTAVKVGIKDENKVEILSGLSEGDLIVSSGQRRLYDGQSVIGEDEKQP